MSTFASFPGASEWNKTRSIALAALKRNRLQTVLTISGMTVGVATVVTMVAIGTGAQQAIQDQVRSAGMNVIVVTSGNYKMKQQWTSDGETEEEGAQTSDRQALSKEEDDDPQNSAGLGASDRLSLADAAATAGLKGVQYVSAGVADNARVQAGEESWFTRLHGESASILQIRRAWSVPHGRFFSSKEVEQAADVAVLGNVVSEHLFGNQNPVGASISAKGHTYRVIGEIASSSWMVPAAQGDDQFDAIYVPVKTAQRAMRMTSLNSLTVSTVSTGEVTTVSKTIADLLRHRHGLHGSTPDDFTVASQAHLSLARGGMRTDIARAVVGNVNYLDKVTLDALAKTLDQASRTMTVLLISVAAVSLIVGGIGIMNIMLLSVTERTREIGIRRAVGARSYEVTFQFLMEAVILSLSGGVLGIVTGMLASHAISSAARWSTALSPLAIALSFGISAAVGIIFGYYPARQAALVVPMSALRYE
jgi:ABC-type antimicrobial peptide transport system permease subunit